ncbi:unnamed protein product [Mycena citricolor]|uniref:HNH nuclease domain-containing protein n=1 Tax=Mycena citricolor TaxID=2018698 RepID=A0AAD2HQS2_9AGAR|nr:unnamed protein product [Mycena citricolor]
MSHRRTDSASSTCTVLTCTSDQFWDVYDNDKLSTIELVRDVLNNAIRPRKTFLRQSDTRFHLDDLLVGMLQQAPDPSGQRYVAVALLIAHEKGTEAVIDIARAWMDYLFLPMLSIARAVRTEPTSSQTPTIDTTVQHIEGADRLEQTRLRDLTSQREQHRCAITGAFDLSFVSKLLQQGRGKEIPDVPQLRMEAAHIIPFLLNDFDNKPDITSEIRDAARTWDMLQSWTNLDLRKILGSKINSPANAIFMTAEEHHSFGRFRFYLDKQTYPDIPNRYQARMVQDGRRFSNGRVSTIVDFRKVEGIDLPDPQFLEIHAAFARVLNLCGAAEYFESVERNAEGGMTLLTDGTTDIESLLLCRLPIAAY